MSKTHFDSNSIEATSDRLTCRAGIAGFAQYIETMGLPAKMAETFPNLKKSKKGIGTKDFFASTLCWLMNGESRHVSSFDDLKEDDTSKALFNVAEVPSSDAAKRIFKKFGQSHEHGFREILSGLFSRKLLTVKPKVVILGVDSMVMDNDDANFRMGVSPTYKKCKGFHPLQMTWMGMIIDATFRSGSRSTHEFKATYKMIQRMVKIVRENLGQDTAIIIRMDAGYCDEKLIRCLDEELKVAFQVGGKIYKNFKADIAAIPEDNWDEYSSGARSWKYLEMGYKCASWKNYYRAIITQVDSREDGTLFLEFARPTSLIITNMGTNSNIFSPSAQEHVQKYMGTESQIELYQGRGAEELCHRGLKDFGFEKLPFKQFGANLAMYHCMLIGFATFELFKSEILVDVVKPTSYATTVRRKFIDIAAKVTTSGNKIYLKLRKTTLKRLLFREVWWRCFNTPPLIV